MLVDDVIAALQELPALANRIEGGLEFSRLVQSDVLPNMPQAAFVFSLGLNPKPSDRATGLHQQQVGETVAVVLVVSKPDDPKGTKARGTVEALIETVVNHLTGRQCASAADVLQFAKGRLVDMRAGAVFWQLDFSTFTYLRKTT